ncbi:MAG: hypothetical protein RL481_2197 [Pseudomonadota bacterium]|jgi:protein ImuA
MNKKLSDSLSLPAAGWGHALAALGGARAGMAEGTRPSLAGVLAALPANACHEIFAKGKGDAASLLGFGAMLGAVLAKEHGPCFFVRPLQNGGEQLYPPGLADLGMDPAGCFSVHAPDLLAALKATADIARSGAAGAVVLEIEGNPRLLDLTASRRLALAAEKAGTAVLLLRMGAREVPSAAYSRWLVASAPSRPDRLMAMGAAIDAPGGPAFDICLLRHRRMAAGQSARLVWYPENWTFYEEDVAPAPGERAGEAAFGAALSLVARRAADQDTRRAA